MRGNIAYYLLLWFSKGVALLPLRLLYATLSPLIYFILYRLVGYRVKVTRDNLMYAFPEKSEQERRQIERKFYKHLADVFIDTIKLSGMSVDEIKRRFIYLNIDEIPTESWICAMSHYGSWELLVGAGLFSQFKWMAVYRPLHSKTFDRFYYTIRSRFFVKPVPMNDILREAIRHRSSEDKRPLVIGLIADQTPPPFDKRHWYEFFHRPAPFFAGMEKMADKFHMPIYFMDVKQTSRGYYTTYMDMIYDGVEKLEEGEITRRYVERLERKINERPELWMWSHRRWKHSHRYNQDNQ